MTIFARRHDDGVTVTLRDYRKGDVMGDRHAVSWREDYVFDDGTEGTEYHGVTYAISDDGPTLVVVGTRTGGFFVDRDVVADVNRDAGSTMSPAWIARYHGATTTDKA